MLYPNPKQSGPPQHWYQNTHYSEFKKVKIQGSPATILTAHNQLEKFLSFLQTYSCILEPWEGSAPYRQQLTGKRVKRSRNMELVRALFRLLKNCVSACWYIKVTLSTSKQPVLKSYREKAEQKFSPETRVIHCYSIHINHCTLIFPTAQCS